MFGKYNPPISSVNESKGGEVHDIFLKLILAITLFVIVFIDIRTNKIPNYLVVFILVLQILVVILSYSSVNIGECILTVVSRIMTALLLLFCLYFFFLIGAIGAGDLKLLFVTALGFNHPEFFSLVALIIAMTMSLIQMIRYRNIRERVRYLFYYLKRFTENKTITHYFSETVTTEEKKKYSIHFSVPVFLAYLLCFILQRGM